MQYLMRDIHLEITRAIWHSHKSDIGQREMLAAVTHQTLREDHPSHDEILWIVSEAGYLSGKRNDFVHTPMAYLHDERGVSLIPHPFEAEERRIHRLEKIMSTDGASHHLRNDYYALGNYAREISAWLGRREQDSNPPLPQRPILLAAKLLGDDRQTTRRRSSARQKPQPRSSRPKV
jgi:hypothetical protein